MIKKHKIKRILFFTIIIFFSLFLLLNISAFIHAYKFTHFTRQDITKTKDPEDLDFIDKLIVLFTGISNPKPQNNVKPHYPYTDLIIKKNDNSILHCWFSQQLNPKGIVLLAHGFSTSKFSLIKEASAFNSMNYDSLLIDLSGHGDSDGNSTSIGYYEADDVYKAFTYIKSNYSYKSIILYGVSMGAVTILHSIYKYKIIPDTIILECPFSGLLSTVKHRFEIMGLPPSPFSELLVFWGSIQNRFNGFSHDSAIYAKKVTIPTLLMYGEKDNRITSDEIRIIYENLSGFKKLLIFEDTGHELYYRENPEKWTSEVRYFLDCTEDSL